MSKAALARRLASELDTSLNRATRIVDDVGEGGARALLRGGDDALPAAQRGAGSLRIGGRNLPSNRALGLGAAGAGLGGGALLWRREGRLADQAQADRAEFMDDSLSEILAADDLPPDLMSELAETAALAAQGEYDPDDDGFELSDLIPGTPDFGIGDTFQLVLVIVLAVVLIHILMDDGGPNISMVTPSAGGDGGAGNG